MGRAWRLLLGAAVAGGLLVGGSGVASANGVWELTEIKVNPADSPDPSTANDMYSVAEGNVARTARRISGGQETGKVDFTTQWGTPPGTLDPGSTYPFLVSISGAISGTNSGKRSHSAQLLQNGRAVSGALISIRQNCNDPIGSDPLTCDPPASETARFEVSVPAFDAGATFSFGVDAGCGSFCTVRYTYTAKPSEASTGAGAPPPACAVPALAGLRATFAPLPARVARSLRLLERLERRALRASPAQARALAGHLQEPRSARPDPEAAERRACAQSAGCRQLSRSGCRGDATTKMTANARRAVSWINAVANANRVGIAEAALRIRRARGAGITRTVARERALARVAARRGRDARQAHKPVAELRRRARAENGPEALNQLGTIESDADLAAVWRAHGRIHNATNVDNVFRAGGQVVLFASPDRALPRDAYLWLGLAAEDYGRNGKDLVFRLNRASGLSNASLRCVRLMREHLDLQARREVLFRSAVRAGLRGRTATFLSTARTAFRVGHRNDATADAIKKCLRSNGARGSFPRVS